MELDFTERLERSVTSPVASALSATVEDGGVELSLVLSLGRSFGDVGSRKRVREGDEVVEGKKPKMEEGLVPCSLKVMPVIFQGPNGYCYAGMVPRWVPWSIDAVENSPCQPRINRTFGVETEGLASGDCQMKVAGAGGLSSSESSSSGSSNLFRSLSAEGESSSTNESKNHSNSATTDNTSPISEFSNSEPGLKKPPIHPKRRNKPALSRKRRALVYTLSAEGKKIKGYLDEFLKNEVRILCDCHGSFFSPAGFVRHAGGPETQHPLRQITVVFG